MGSFSRIEKTTGDKATYELYGSGDMHIGRLLHNRRFDFAMVSFLDCLKQLIDHVKLQDPHIEFPHQYDVYLAVMKSLTTFVPSGL
jgi:beclin